MSIFGRNRERNQATDLTSDEFRTWWFNEVNRIRKQRSSETLRNAKFKTRTPLEVGQKIAADIAGLLIKGNIKDVVIIQSDRLAVKKVLNCLKLFLENEYSIMPLEENNRGVLYFKDLTVSFRTPTTYGLYTKRLSAETIVYDHDVYPISKMEYDLIK